MKHRAILPAIAMVALIALTGCPDKNRPAPEPTQQNTAADPDPHWVIQQQPPAKVALVYVHGVTGDMIGTWQAANGKTFFELVNENEVTRGRADAFVYGFPSYMFRQGSFDIREAANRLHQRLMYNRVLDYPAVVFVAHSMGGLVVMRELLTNRDVLAKVPVVVFYATPQEGAQISSIGQHLSPNSALAQMTPADGNALLQTLSDEWNTINPADRPHVRCAYEKKTTGPFMIVPWSSATRFCEGAPLAIDANHIEIVKPDRPGHDSILVLVNALNDYVLNQSLEAKLETPDFVTESDHAVFVLHNGIGKQHARLVNAGGGPLRYTLAEVSDPALLLWPEDTPRQLAARTADRIGIALLRGSTGNEYHFILRSDVTPDQKVIVRVPDMPAVQQQQAEIAAAFASDLNAALSEPGAAARFRRAPAESAEIPEEAVRIARDSVAKQVPDLPEGAQWVLAADMLSAMNWPSLAATALKHAEQASPAVTRLPGVERLAGVVAAQSGEKTIFANTATPVAAPDALASWRTSHPLAQPATANLAADVAKSMQEVPALRALGFSLQGDIEQANGNAAAAHSAYTEAARIRPSPSVTLRLQNVPLRNDTARNAQPVSEALRIQRGATPSVQTVTPSERDDVARIKQREQLRRTDVRETVRQ